MKKLTKLLLCALAIFTSSSALAQDIVATGTILNNDTAGAATFAARCAESGVLVCHPIDDDGEITAYLWNNSETWDSDRSSSGSEYATFVPTGGCRGTGAADLQDRPGNNESNIYLSYPLSGAASGNSTGSSDIDYTVTIGETVWAQFCFMMTATQYTNEDSTDWSGHKIFSFTSEWSSNTAQESFLMRNSGRKYFSVSNTNVDPADLWFYVDYGSYIDVQPGSEYGLCKYNEDDPIDNADTCYIIEPGVQYSVLVGETVGHTTFSESGLGDTHIRVYMAKRGDLAYTKIYDRADLPVYAYDEDGPQGPGYSSGVLWNRHECIGESCVEEGSKASGLSQQFSDLIIKKGTTPPPLPDWSEWGISAPSWVTDIPVGTWDVVNLTGRTLSDEAPASGAHTGNNGITCLIDDCWNGATFASGWGNKGGLFVWGGGHHGYFGSEVYVFDMETQDWSRLTSNNGIAIDCSLGYGVDATGTTDGRYNVSGLPVAPHTYNTLLYHPPSNSIGVMFPERNACGGDVIPRPAFFSLDTLTWTFGTKNLSVSPRAGGWAVWDSTRNLMLNEGGDTGGEFIEYQITGTGVTTGTFSSHASNYRALESGAGVDTENDVLIASNAPYGCATTDVYALDMDDLDASPTIITTAGSQPVLCKSAFEYVASESGFIVRADGNAEDDDVYLFKRTSGSPLGGTWTWSNITSGSNSVTPDIPVGYTGRYGNFRCMEYSDATVCVEVNSVNGDVYGFRVN